MDRRLLTPAEAALLLAPNTGTASKCLQAGLLSLLGFRRISIEASTGAFTQSALLLNTSRELPGVALPAHLRALEQALITYGNG